MSTEPDWDEAPKWAMWWAVDSDGAACWYDVRPHVQGCWWASPEETLCRYKAEAAIQIPAGCDWRLLIRQRPEDPS